MWHIFVGFNPQKCATFCGKHGEETMVGFEGCRILSRGRQVIWHM